MQGAACTDCLHWDCLHWVLLGGIAVPCSTCPTHPPWRPQARSDDSRRRGPHHRPGRRGGTPAVPAALLPIGRWAPGQGGYLHLHQYARRPLHPGPPPPMASGECRIGCCGTGRGTAGKRGGPALQAAGGAIPKGRIPAPAMPSNPERNKERITLLGVEWGARGARCPGADPTSYYSIPKVTPALAAAAGRPGLGLQRPRLQVCPRDWQHPRRPGAEPERRERARSGHRAAPPPQGAARPGRGAGRIAGRCHMKLAAYE